MDVRDGNGECWFKDSDHPNNLTEAYCWLKGELLVRELEAIGEKRLAKRCFDNLSARQAGRFGRKLDRLAAKLREESRVRPFGSRRSFSERVSFYDEKSREWTLRPYSTTLERVVEILEKGGRWYRRASALGSGVVAWY
jgi:hypothetical protein